MTINSPASAMATFRQKRLAHSTEPYRKQTIAQKKARQSAKIRELKEALVKAGICTLDEQATSLGLNRSTTWTILKGKYKGSGLSAKIINRILAAPRLPPPVRARVLEYVEEKVAGLYGHGKAHCQNFIDRLSIEPGEQAIWKDFFGFSRKRKARTLRQAAQPTSNGRQTWNLSRGLR
jgi:hypothetical protein